MLVLACRQFQVAEKVSRDKKERSGIMFVVIESYLDPD